MELTTGEVYEGKVTGITKFGAFVSLENRKSGLVHISEIADTFVSDINSYLKIDQVVRVKLINITTDGKLNFSIKRALEQQNENAEGQRPSARPETAAPRPKAAEPIRSGELYQDSGDTDFENRLKKFMQLSDSKLADNRIYSDHRQRSRRR